MASVGGRLAKVVYNGNTIAGLGTWSMSGFVPDIVEDTAFGDTVKKWKRAGIDDAGEVSFSGNYDPDDTAGQIALNALSTVDGGVTKLYFYENTTKFWRVVAGGSIVLTKFNAVTMTKNGLGTVEFTGKISGKAMERK